VLSALTDLPWAQLIVNGLALGSLYALTAFGLVLIFKTTEVVTFAQGEMAMVSTFVAYTLLTTAHLPFAAAFVLTLVFATLLGILIERLILRYVNPNPILNPIIVTIGLALILLGVAGWIWGYETRPFPAPVAGPPFRLGTVVLSRMNALILGVMLLLQAILFLFFRRSLTGIAMNAVAQNRLAARLMGINVGRINALSWGVASALGAVTGVLIAPLVYLDPNMMGDVVLKAFTAAVLGGFTSLPGAVVGGLWVSSIN
jgi:branched-chain amino acid transport system permease protein